MGWSADADTVQQAGLKLCPKIEGQSLPSFGLEASCQQQPSDSDQGRGGPGPAWPAAASRGPSEEGGGTIRGGAVGININGITVKSQSISAKNLLGQILFQSFPVEERQTAVEVALDQQTGQTGSEACFEEAAVFCRSLEVF